VQLSAADCLRIGRFRLRRPRGAAGWWRSGGRR
jgi:hypothetical protein